MACWHVSWWGENNLKAELNFFFFFTIIIFLLFFLGVFRRGHWVADNGSMAMYQGKSRVAGETKHCIGLSISPRAISPVFLCSSVSICLYFNSMYIYIFTKYNKTCICVYSFTPHCCIFFFCYQLFFPLCILYTIKSTHKLMFFLKKLKKKQIKFIFYCLNGHSFPFASLFTSKLLFPMVN